MISDDLYEQYEDEYSDGVGFEKFTRKAPKSAVKPVKTTKFDEINAKRRERQSEKDAMVAKQDEGIVIFN